MLVRPRITPAPKTWPKQVVPRTAPRPKPPNMLAEGIPGPVDCSLIVALPNAIASTLQISMIRPIVGLQLVARTATASRVGVNNSASPIKHERTHEFKTHNVD